MLGVNFKYLFINLYISKCYSYTFDKLMLWIILPVNKKIKNTKMHYNICFKVLKFEYKKL